jgi:hypothetical protein
MVARGKSYLYPFPSFEGSVKARARRCSVELNELNTKQEDGA